MALAAVLSAMKDLILIAPELPNEQSERLVYINKTFPALSDSEAEDLAKINPDKFKIYTHSIFSAERDLIARNFSMTIEYLKRYWQESFGQSFDLLRLAKDLHKKKPWKSSTSVDLGKIFLEFLNEDCYAILSKAPFLTELADMELSLRISRRSPDDQIMPHDSADISTLTSMTVEEILNLNYLIPSNVQFKEFNYNLIAARSAFITDRLLPEDIETKKIYSSLSRNRDAYQRWSEYPQEVYLALTSQELQKPYSLSILAEEFLKSSDGSKSEIDLFKEFIAIIVHSSEAGTIVFLS